MKKKIHPKDQTKEMSSALYEFMQRNQERKSEYDKKEGDNFRAICKKIGISDDEAEAYIRDSMSLWAALDCEYILYDSWWKVFKDFFVKEDIHPLDYDYMKKNSMWREQILKDAESILDQIIFPLPAQSRIVVINLARTKEAIMAEVEEIVTNAVKAYQKKRNEVVILDDDGKIIDVVNNKKKERNKWLPITPELLEVWDLYKQAGQHPWLKTFRNISRKVGRPLSTVKDQWCQAFEKIYGKKYTPEIKYATEEKRRDADVLCVSCPYIIEKDGKPDHAKCQRRGDWYPCSEYLSIAGKAMSVESVEYDDDIDYSRPNPRKSRKNKHE
jgi:hypothetical protein